MDGVPGLLRGPPDSLVLSWIERADPAQRGSTLITEEVVAEEYDAMLSWISYSARCGADACAPMENPCGAPPSAEDCEFSRQPARDETFDDPGDCSDATLEALFDARVYAWRGRCSPCHFPGEDVEAPKWVAVGSCALGASQTMHEVLRTGLVDVDDPARSLLLLKPLDEEDGGVVHGGHNKMASTEDPAYVDFLEWLTRYADCQR